MMTSKEWKRLKQFHNLNIIQRSHSPLLQGRKHVKGAGKHVGVVLKRSSVRNQVHIETIFMPHKL